MPNLPFRSGLAILAVFMGPKTTRLIAVLVETIPLLQEHGADYYADWIAKRKKLLGRSDFRGITHILGVFGGMGSSNDVVITPNDDRPEEPHRASVNKRFRILRSTIYEIADSIRRVVDRNNG